MKKGLLVFTAVIIIIVVFFCSTYNGLVTKHEEVNKKESDISVQLERRADLIPNLVKSVKGYMDHEQKVIDSVTKARENLVNAKSMEDKANANEQLSSALNNLFVIVENYPDLKTNTNFIQLQDELSGTENRIAVARRDYNNAVKDYNGSIKKFPTNFVANMFGFSKADYFKSKESANNVPDVSFE